MTQSNPQQPRPEGGQVHTPDTRPDAQTDQEHETQVQGNEGNGFWPTAEPADPMELLDDATGLDGIFYAPHAGVNLGSAPQEAVSGWRRIGAALTKRHLASFELLRTSYTYGSAGALWMLAQTLDERHIGAAYESRNSTQGRGTPDAQSDPLGIENTTHAIELMGWAQPHSALVLHASPMGVSSYATLLSLMAGCLALHVQTQNPEEARRGTPGTPDAPLMNPLHAAQVCHLIDRASAAIGLLGGPATESPLMGSERTNRGHNGAAQNSQEDTQTHFCAITGPIEAPLFEATELLFTHLPPTAQMRLISLCLTLAFDQMQELDQADACALELCELFLTRGPLADPSVIPSSPSPFSGGLLHVALQLVSHWPSSVAFTQALSVRALRQHEAWLTRGTTHEGTHAKPNASDTHHDVDPTGIASLLRSTCALMDGLFCIAKQCTPEPTSGPWDKDATDAPGPLPLDSASALHQWALMSADYHGPQHTQQPTYTLSATDTHNNTDSDPDSDGLTDAERALERAFEMPQSAQEGFEACGQEARSTALAEWAKIEALELLAIGADSAHWCAMSNRWLGWGLASGDILGFAALWNQHTPLWTIGAPLTVCMQSAQFDQRALLDFDVLTGALTNEEGIGDIPDSFSTEDPAFTCLSELIGASPFTWALLSKLDSAFAMLEARRLASMRWEGPRLGFEGAWAQAGLRAIDIKGAAFTIETLSKMGLLFIHDPQDPSRALGMARRVFSASPAPTSRGMGGELLEWQRTLFGTQKNGHAYDARTLPNGHGALGLERFGALSEAFDSLLCPPAPALHRAPVEAPNNEPMGEMDGLGHADEQADPTLDVDGVQAQQTGELTGEHEADAVGSAQVGHSIRLRLLDPVGFYQTACALEAHLGAHYAQHAEHADGEASEGGTGADFGSTQKAHSGYIFASPTLPMSPLLAKPTHQALISLEEAPGLLHVMTLVSPHTQEDFYECCKMASAGHIAALESLFRGIRMGQLAQSVSPAGPVSSQPQDAQSTAPGAHTQMGTHAGEASGGLAPDWEAPGGFGPLGLALHQMGMHRPLMERSLEAAFLAASTNLGALGPSYAPICAAGSNAALLHYHQNKNIINPDDWVLLDMGVRFGGYSSDITRCAPANGRFDGLRGELYQGLLSVQKRLIKSLAPGVCLKDLQEATLRLLAELLEDLKLVDGSWITMQKTLLGLKNNVPLSYLIAKELMGHSVSHRIGSLTHLQAPNAMAPWFSWTSASGSTQGGKPAKHTKKTQQSFGAWDKPYESTLSVRSGSFSDIVQFGTGTEYERRLSRAALPSASANIPLTEGCALTVEPGLYFHPALANLPEEISLGFGLRIEDVVLLVPGGGATLTAYAPKEVAHISAIAQQCGLIK